jgi:hypothetical protein
LNPYPFHYKMAFAFSNFLPRHACSECLAVILTTSYILRCMVAYSDDPVACFRINERFRSVLSAGGILSVCALAATSTSIPLTFLVKACHLPFAPYTFIDGFCEPSVNLTMPFYLSPSIVLGSNEGSTFLANFLPSLWQRVP